MLFQPLAPVPPAGARQWRSSTPEAAWVLHKAGHEL